MGEDILKDTLVLTGISEETDEETKKRVEKIIDIVSRRLKSLLGGVAEIPPELAYIVTEVSVIRYNRIGSEGLSSHGVTGESMSWQDDDFSSYAADIRAYMDRQETANRGRVRFL